MARIYINVELGVSINIIFFTTKKSALANAKEWTSNKRHQEKYNVTEIETWEMRDDCGLGYYKSELDDFEQYGKLIAITRHQE